ncbi:MAG: DUF4270 family protein [Flavobacteriales bacterium]|nr:DUF4270 family protein [Flavobacteriales bacterium]
MNSISSPHIIRKAIWVSVFIFALSCKKGDNFIGSELQNEDINVSQLTNFTINTYTKEADSLKADELSVSTLGSMKDAELGKTESSFFTQLRLPVENVDFTSGGSLSDIVLDSIVLTLEYFDHYGNLDAQTFEVYEVSDNIDIDSTYYNGTTFTNAGTNLVESGKGTLTPNPTSKVFNGTDTVSAQLRLKLDNSFGQLILNESGNATLSNNTSFAQFLKGIEVKVNNPGQANGSGAILLFNLISANSNVTLYYRNTVTSDTLFFNLLMNTNCARVNLNTHDYTGTMVAPQLLDSTLGITEVYVQGLKGLKTQIELTDIMNLKDSNIIINKAVLTMPVNTAGSSTFEPIEQMLIVRNEDGEKYLLPDQTQFSGLAGLQNVGGAYSEDDEQYEFIITRYVNAVLTGLIPNNTLTLETISAMVTPNRSVLYGSGSLVAQPQLTITYTKY